MVLVVVNEEDEETDPMEQMGSSKADRKQQREQTNGTQCINKLKFHSLRSWCC